jgi:hypothetical protein
MDHEAVKAITMEEALPHLAAGQSVILTIIDRHNWQILEAMGTVEYEFGEDAEQFCNWFRILARAGLSVRINIDRTPR